MPDRCFDGLFLYRNYRFKAFTILFITGVNQTTQVIYCKLRYIVT